MENKKIKLEDMPEFLYPPFRYNGSLIYEIEKLLPLIPEHDIYVEPFCGGASQFFGKPKANTNWLNDVDKDMMAAYKLIRDQPEKLIQFLEKEKNSEERYTYFKTEFQPKNNYETAIRWFYLNKISCLNTINMFWKRDDKLNLKPRGWRKSISECSDKLQNVKLTSEDFEQVINAVPEGAFLCINPPYSIHHSSAQNKLHKHPFEREDHLRLASALKQNESKIKFMITYNNNAELRKLYSWNRGISIVNISNDPPWKDEIVIMNYKRE
jgi:DNA adenine methylase